MTGLYRPRPLRAACAVGGGSIPEPRTPWRSHREPAEGQPGTVRPAVDRYITGATDVAIAYVAGALNHMGGLLGAENLPLFRDRVVGRTGVPHRRPDDAHFDETEKYKPDDEAVEGQDWSRKSDIVPTALSGKLIDLHERLMPQLRWLRSWHHAKHRKAPISTGRVEWRGGCRSPATSTTTYVFR